jgi:hypothetical protein
MGSSGRGNKYKNASILSAFFLAYINGVDTELLINTRKTIANNEYVYDGYDYNRFLPAVKLNMSLRSVSLKYAKPRYDSFLRTMYAIQCIEKNRHLKAINRPIDEIVYDISYNGKSFSKCHEKRVMNQNYKIV